MGDSNPLAVFPVKRNKTVLRRKAQRANKIVQRAIQEGWLARSLESSACGKECYTYAHHESYNYPLEVVWLCASCHKRRDLEREAEYRTAYLASLSKLRKD